MRADSEYLGIVSDLSGFADGELRMDISYDRRESMLELTRKHRFALPKGPASSLFGKARFMLTPAYGAIGRACLQPIKAKQFSESTEITPEIADSLDFIAYACEHLPPINLPLLLPNNARVVVFVDAEGKRRPRGRGGVSPPIPSGHVGFVVHHPTLGVAHGSGAIPDPITRLFDTFKKPILGSTSFWGRSSPFSAFRPLGSQATK